MALEGTILVLALAVIIGFIMGAVGIGGILLIVPLTMIAGLDIHQASATLLLTFLFTGIYSVWLFQRRGTIDWRLGIPVSLGALTFSFVGAIANVGIDATTLNIVIALVITFAGAYVLFPGLARASRKPVEGSKGTMVALLAIGAVSGFGSGISGAGGPLFSVPIMLISGFAPLTAIGTGMVLQVVSAASGSVGNFLFGSIDFYYAALITICELVGVSFGVRFAHSTNAAMLRNMAGLLCLLPGLTMLLRTIQL
jgi:uncharacterized membrane protein YfcA